MKRTSATPHPRPDADALAREAAELLAEAMALRMPSGRARHRQLLEGAIERAEEALRVADAAELQAASSGRSPAALGADASARSARAPWEARSSSRSIAIGPRAPGDTSGALEVALSTLVRAHAAKAEDARHGAGQLARGSQRAPTRADCDDGWERVESIVENAEASAAEARRLAQLLPTFAVQKAARAAGIAAREARRIVDERNHAYTFHADPGFSFGEGWHLAAAAVLAGVSIQIEREKKQTAQAERFLLDAGLASLLQPYRPRPRANKQLTGIVAEAFRADPLGAQNAVREAFLGGESVPPAVAGWIDRKLAGAPARRKVLLWVRYGAHDAHRNTTHAEIEALASRAQRAGLVPILIGDALRGGEPPPGAVDLALFFREAPFQGIDMRRAQLQLFEHLRTAHGLVGQVGVTTAGMDGPALLGLPTIYLTQAPNVRMRQWVGALPGYEEVVREGDWLGRVSETMRRWATHERI